MCCNNTSRSQSQRDHDQQQGYLMTTFKPRAWSMAALLGLSAISSAAYASNYPIVLVHGFQPSQLQSRPVGTAVSQAGAAYWSEYWGSRAAARIDWPSQERVKEKISTDYVWPVLKQLSQQGTCRTGCVFVTHSTGDLVTRYILENQANWLRNAGMEPLNIVATVDFAGAGGGSELADLALNVIDGNAGWLVQQAVGLWLGTTPTRGNAGVLNDLQVNSARQLATTFTSRVPRLRMVGGASDYVGATSPFLPGDDDGVVAPHSSCGATTAGDFNSCVGNVALSGKLTSVKAPSSRYPQHYPVLMSDKYSHASVLKNSVAGRFTTATSSVSYSNGVNWQVKATDKYYGFPYYATWRYVNSSDTQSMSALVFQQLP